MELLNYQSQDVKIRLPLPDADSMLHPIQALTYKMTECTLNLPLLRALCVRALDGDVSLQDMQTYAVGYSLRRFTNINKIVTNTNIAYDQLDLHIIAALMATSHMNSRMRGTNQAL